MQYEDKYKYYNKLAREIKKAAKIKGVDIDTYKLDIMINQGVYYETEDRGGADIFKEFSIWVKGNPAYNYDGTVYESMLKSRVV